MRYSSFLKIVMPVLLLAGSVAPSWAGGGGFGLGLGLGALFTADVIAHSYPPYYPYPYDAPYYYPPPYYYPAQVPYAVPQPTNSYAYAQPPVAAPADQSISPDTSRHTLASVNDYHLELRALLDQKLKNGEITKRQQEAEAESLDQMDRQAQDGAAANGGYLTGDQERALVQQYQRDYYLINHNFVIN